MRVLQASLLAAVATAVKQTGVRRNLQDTTNPEVMCKTSLAIGLTGSTVTVGPEAGSGVDFVATDSITDNVGITDVFIIDDVNQTNETQTILTYNCSDIGTDPEISVAAFDAEENFGVCSTDATIRDTGLPSPSCTDITVELSATGSATVSVTDIDGGSSDNCDDSPTLVVTSGSSFSCTDLGMGGPGTGSSTLQVTDDAGNAATCTSTITIQDTIAPTITCTANVTIELETSGADKMIDVAVSPNDYVTANDNCGVSIQESTMLTYTCSDVVEFENGAPTSTLRSDTFTPVDGQGNTGTTCDFTPRIRSKDAPTISCPTGTVTVTMEENFKDLSIAEIGGFTSASDCSDEGMEITDAQVTCSDIGSVATKTAVVTDKSGRTNQCTFSVSIVDDREPDANCLTNVEVLLDDNGEYQVTPDDINNNSDDNCKDNLVLTVTAADGMTKLTCDDVGKPKSFSLVATDTNPAHSDTCEGVVSAVDKNAPVVTCSDQTITLNASGNGALDQSKYTSVDGCDGAVSPAFVRTDVTCADVGTTFDPVATFTDTSGNAATCGTTPVVTVVDDTDPTATCVAALDAVLDGNGEVNITAAMVGSATDNCPDVTSSIDVTAFGCANVGANTVTFTATDKSMNTVTCPSTVTVKDTEAPAVTCKANFDLALGSTGTASLVAADIKDASSDNCAIASETVSATSFACADKGTATTVTLTVTDENGNANTCTTDVTPKDSTAPTVTACQDAKVTLSGGSGSISASSFTATDNCDGSVTASLSTSTFDCDDNLKTRTVTVTFEDSSGNTATCTADIEVETPSFSFSCFTSTIFSDPIGWFFNFIGLPGLF